jgi:molybdenum cofactor biosynthesis enzyme
VADDSIANYNGFMAQKLSHVDESGQARMVDVSQKSETERIAVARGSVLVQPQTLQLIIDGRVMYCLLPSWQG